MLELKKIDKYYNPGTVNEMCLFDGFDLTVADGEFVSVVGSNGSGKTSMLNILCGSIPVDGGKILMNGKDITNKKEFKRNRNIGRVYQNPSMGTCPSMTILENMSLADNKGKFFGLGAGINKARREEYREMLSQLGLGLENKMDVKVGVLSGGQRQRLTIARALVRDPQILIMDDSASALDFATDARLRKAIRENTKDMTVFIVSQRATTIRNADTILVLDDGKLAGMGSHKQLLKECDVYREICLSQLSKEEVERDEQ